MDNYFESQEFLELLADYERCIKHGEMHFFDTDSMLDIGHYFVNNRQYQDTIILVDHACWMHHNKEQFIPLKIEALINLKRTDEAEELLGEINPEEDYDFYYFKAQLILAKQPLNETNKKVIDALFFTWLKAELAELGNISKEEEEEFDAVIGVREAFMHIMASYTELCKSYTDIYQQAMHFWKELYLKYCKPIGGYDIDLDIARIYHDAGLADEEEELYELMLDTNPYLPDGWAYLASIQHMNNHHEDAIVSSEYALAINPKDEHALMVQAGSNFVLGNYKASTNSYLKLLQLDKENTLYNQCLGGCYMVQGEVEKGMEYLLQSIELQKKQQSTPYEDAYLYSTCAEAFMVGKMFSLAEYCIDQALQYDSELTDFLLIKAECCLRMDNIIDALHYFDKAIENTSAKCATSIFAGGLFVEEGYLDESLKYLLPAAEFPERNIADKAYAYLAFVYKSLHKKILFRRYLKLACEKEPEFVRNLWTELLQDANPSDYFDIVSRTFK